MAIYNIIIILQYRTEVIETLNKHVVVRIKEINLSCYSLVIHPGRKCNPVFFSYFNYVHPMQLVPIWSEVTLSVADTNFVSNEHMSDWLLWCIINYILPF